MTPRTYESAAREARAEAQRHAAKGDLSWAAMRNRDADALERRAAARSGLSPSNAAFYDLLEDAAVKLCQALGFRTVP